MVTRVTTAQRFSLALRNILISINRVQDIQEKIVTGKLINRPSDDPGGISKAFNIRRLLGDNKQFSRNIENNRAFLNVADQTLGTISNLVREVRDLTVSQVGGTADAQTRAATSVAVARLRESIIQQANTQVSGRFIFSGSRIFTPAYAVDGRFQGDQQELRINISLSDSAPVNVTGTDFLSTDLDPALFQSAGFVKGIATTDEFIIDASNDGLVVNEFGPGATDTLTLAAGTYTGDALAAEVQTRLNASGVLTGTYTVTYDEAQDRFNFSVTGPTGGMQIVSSGTNAASTAAAVLGFNVDSSQAASLQSSTQTAFNVITGVNDVFSISVNGGTSTPVTVDQGVFTGESLANNIQLRINNVVKEVTTANNQIRILEDGGLRAETLTIGAGTKSGATLTSDLQTALNASATLQGTYTVTYNAATDKFTISVAGAASTVGVDVSEGALAGLMGFSADSPNAVNVISDTNITGAKVDYNSSFRDSFSIFSPTVGTGSSIGVTVGANDILTTLDLNGVTGTASRSTALADLNAGTGVAPGFIQITNRAQQVFQVDLTTATDLNDVITQIGNTVTGVTASISGDGKRLILTDTNSPQISNLIVEEVGTTTTAADLGIKGTASGDIVGKDLDPTVSQGTLIAALRKGAGVNLGQVAIGSDVIDLAVGSAATVKEIVDEVNNKSSRGAASISSDGKHLRLDPLNAQTSALITDVTGSAAKELGFQGRDNVLGLLETVEQALMREDTEVLEASLDELNAAIDRVNLQRVRIGEVTRQFERIQEQQEEVAVSFSELRSKIEDTGMVEALTKFSTFQNTFQAALASSAQILQVQFLDFLS